MTPPLPPPNCLPEAAQPGRNGNEMRISTCHSESTKMVIMASVAAVSVKLRIEHVPGLLLLLLLSLK